MSCMSAGLIIPTTAINNGLATGTNNFENYCGAYLNPLEGQKIGAVVSSNF